MKTEGDGLITLTVSRTVWSEICAICKPAEHEHADGINECQVCDEPVMEVALRKLKERIGELSDSELLNELIRRNEVRLESDPEWTRFRKLRRLLFDAGKILAEWNGRETTSP